MPSIKSRDKFYFWYFIIHIPITVLIDSCIIIPKNYQLNISKALLDFHVSQNKDFLLIDLPLWFKVFGFFEILVQLPFFAIGSYYLHNMNKKIYPFMILYGFNAFFTTLVCLTYIYMNSIEKNLSNLEVVNLIGLYLPYLIIPLLIMVDFTHRVVLLIDTKEQEKKTT